MKDQSVDSSSRLYVSLWLPTALLGVMLLVILFMQVLLSWKAHQRLIPVAGHSLLIQRLQANNQLLQEEWMAQLQGKGEFTTAERKTLQESFQGMVHTQVQLDSGTTSALKQALQILSDREQSTQQTVTAALAITRQMLRNENVAHHRLIDEISRSTTLELEIGLIALLVFPSVAILLIYLLRRRILKPIDHLGFLMSLLGDRDYKTAPMENIDPILQPLSERYNTMVERLHALEREHESREQDLEQQVRTATATLLEQQRNLANSERLAAVGETMARIAHELRNPLAGIKLACVNLRQDMQQAQSEPDYIERMDIVTDEIERIVNLLNSLLEQSRHRPEPLTEVKLSSTVADLAKLFRYQLPANIIIQQSIADGLVCELPRSLFSQALLNLILNAADALGDAGGTISISAEADGQQLQLAVCDDGPGFPPAMLSTGVRPFVTQRSGGTGLGLSMVERFVRNQGGTLKLANIEPHGGRINIELPCRREHV